MDEWIVAEDFDGLGVRGVVPYSSPSSPKAVDTSRDLLPCCRKA